MAINTLLFDCDNTLVLSEELAFAACADLINEICAAHNLEVRFTAHTLIQEFVGQNFRGMVTSLRTRHSLPIADAELEDYVRREEDAVIARLKKDLVPCPGVMDQLEALSKSAEYKLSVVSSSAKRRVLASLEKVGQDKFFADDVVFSAASSLPKPTSKPDPAVYLFAAETLGKKPEECLAIEDSKSGTLSAVRAGIPVLGYVGPYTDDAAKLKEMEGVLRDAGAQYLMKHWDEFPAALAAIKNASKI